MKTVKFLCILFIVFVVPVTCFGWGENKPSKRELKTALIQKIPGHVQVKKFSIEAMQNLGNKVDPNYASRFEATVKIVVDLFKKESTENGVIFVRRTFAKGKFIPVFGKIQSKLYQGAWRNTVAFEGNPILNLGKPINQFSGGRIIARNSHEEKEYLAEKAEQEKERKEEIERKKAELRKNISNAKEIITGTWRRRNEDADLLVYKPNGICIEKTNHGYTLYQKWRIEEDTIIEQNEKLSQHGKEVQLKKEHKKPVRLQIIYIDNDTFTVKAPKGHTISYDRVK